MKLILFLSFSYFLIPLGNTQNYESLISSDIYWDVQYGDGSQICNLSGGDRYYLQGDTIIQGLKYSIVRAHPIENINTGSYCPPFAVNNSISQIKGFIREDTTHRKLWVFDTHLNTEHLLYDFSLSDGDTLSSTFAGQGATLIVDSTSNILLNTGESRKIIYLNNGQYYIESIGGSQGIIFPMVEAIGYWNTPSCVIENGISLITWPNGGNNSCLNFLGINDPLPQQLNIFPNPARSYTTIEWKLPVDKVVLTIKDISGRIILKVPIEQRDGSLKWDTQNTTDGIYFYELSNANKRLATGKIVVQR